MTRNNKLVCKFEGLYFVGDKQTGLIVVGHLPEQRLVESKLYFYFPLS